MTPGNVPQNDSNAIVYLAGGSLGGYGVAQAKNSKEIDSNNSDQTNN